MPIHEWSRVDAGIFHHFHQHWVGVIADVLNQRLLSSEYYALIKRQGAGQLSIARLTGENGGGLLLAAPRVRVTAETDLDFYRRKQNVVAVRHASGDELAAIVEVVSKGN